MKHLALTLGTSLALAACADTDPTLGTSEPPSTLATQAGALNVLHNVPYLKQTVYTGIGESACAPTSLAMLIRHYYPESFYDVREAFHGGTQGTKYDGPAIGYRNLSFASGATGSDPGTAAIPSGFTGYYTYMYVGGGKFSGAASWDGVLDSLRKMWGFTVTSYEGSTAIDSVYAAIADGPLLASVYAHGNTKWGHYLVIVGINDKGTTSRNDDTIYLNDPYDNQWFSGDVSGNKRPVPYAEFFFGPGKKGGSAWFRRAAKLVPADGVEARKHSVLVDSGHLAVSGNASVHKMELIGLYDQVGSQYAWRQYVVGTSFGDWMYPTAGGKTARWTPKLSASGNYRVTTVVRGDATSGKVTYAVKSNTGATLATKTIDQYRSPAAWISIDIASSVALQNGATIEATSIPVNSNVDAIKLTWIGASSSGGGSSGGCTYACSTYNYSPGLCNGGWQCDCSGQCITKTGCTASTTCGGAATSCQFPCANYGYSAGYCQGGWQCDCAGQCITKTGCASSLSCGG